jgi:hypothetical protein
MMLRPNPKEETVFPSDRFAAFLAHCLNSAKTQVLSVEPGHLYVVLVDALAAKYKESLLYHSSYRARLTEEEAAVGYFKLTLERALWLSNKVEMSIAHRLLGELCRRGVGSPWEGVELRREPYEAPPRENVVASGSFAAVTARLAKLPHAIAKGNPAETIRQRNGNLWLVLGALRTQVPEQISPWDAIVCAPTLLKALPAGEPFNRFCGVVIDTLRTANRPFQELLGLGRGICPFDWVDALSTNQVRALRRFLEVIDDVPDSMDVWSRAWSKAAVPGFKSAAELWSSEIGRALRGPSLKTRSDRIDLIEDDDPGPDVLERHEFHQRLEILQKHDVISAIDRSILERLYDGASLAELAAEASVQKMLAEHQMKFVAYIDGLQRRIEDWRVPDGEHQ